MASPYDELDAYDNIATYDGPAVGIGIVSKINAMWDNADANLSVSWSKDPLAFGWSVEPRNYGWSFDES